MPTQVHVKHFKTLNSPDESQPDSVYFVFGENHVGILVSDEEGNVKPVVVDIDVLTNLVNEALEDVHIGGTWGQINGTLASQTDLVAALAAKAPINYGINAQTGATYTLQASDNGKVITFSNACKVSVPTGLGAGFNCRLVQIGIGQVTVEAAGTTINNRQQHNKLAGRYASATLTAYASNTFVFAGDTTKVSLLLDLITAVPDRAFSFRRLSGAYSGYCAAVRPVGSGGAWTDIGFDANDWFDEAAALAVGSDLNILRYDQSGNNNHETIVPTTTLPRLEFNVLNGKVARKFTSGDWVGMGGLSAFTQGEIHRLFKLADDPPPSGNGTFWAFGNSGSSIHVPFTDGIIYDDFGSTTRKTVGNPGLSMTSWRLVSTYSKANDWKYYLDANLLHSDNANTVGFNTACVLSSDRNYWDSEVLVFPEEIGSTDRQKIWDNIEEYYVLAF